MSNTAKTPDQAPAQTTDQLQADLTQAKAALAAQAAQIEQLEGEKAAQATQLQRAQEDMGEVKAIIDGQAAQIGVLEGEKATLAAENAKLRATPPTHPTITVEGETYRVTAPKFQYKKREYTVADLLGDEQLQAELVAKGMGFLELVSEEEDGNV